MSVRSYRKMLSVLLAVIVVIGGGYCYREWRAEKAEREASVSELSGNLLIPGGMPVGIYMETDGVMVLGTQEIKGKDGIGVNPANDVQLHPTKDEGGAYKLGIWVRDNAQGLGTITFLNADSEYGALGHGIHDVDTGKLIEMSTGRLYDTSIQNIKKGENGNPGGMEGIIVYNHYNILGSITTNTETGIYGKLDRIERIFDSKEAYPAVAKEEIQVGKAYIRCAVSGKTEDYTVRITKVDLDAREVNKGIEIQVTDKRLLKLTGGIVQGMSGSPIMQNGKIIGAVTHVFVQDATKGYGIFIENMLENLKKD